MIGSIKAKSFILKVLPYMISLSAGTAVYILTKLYIKDEGLNGLIVNIAAALLSIPLIFIFYEVIDHMCSKDIKNEAFQHISFEINYVVIDLLKMIHTLLNIDEKLNQDNLEALLKKDKKFIKTHLKPIADLSPALQSNKDKLLALIYGNANLDVLSDTQLKSLLGIAKNAGILAKEIEQIKTNSSNDMIEGTILTLLSLLAKWIEQCEEDALLNHHSFHLL